MKITFALIIFTLLNQAQAEYGQAFTHGVQLFFNADQKFVITDENTPREGLHKVFNYQTGKLVTDISRPFSISCPLRGSDLVTFGYTDKNLGDGQYEFVKSVHVFEQDFTQKTVLPMGVEIGKVDPIGICDLNSNQLFVIQNYHGHEWVIPNRTIQVFNGNTNQLETIELPSYMWDSRIIVDVAVSEKTNQIAILHSGTYNQYKQIDFFDRKNMQRLGSIYVKWAVTTESFPLRVMKFSKDGEHLIYDNRIIYDTNTKAQIYMAPELEDSNKENFMESLNSECYVFYSYSIFKRHHRVVVYDQVQNKELVNKTFYSESPLQAFTVSNNKKFMVFKFIETLINMNLEDGSLKTSFIKFSIQHEMTLSPDDTTLIYEEDFGRRLEFFKLPQ